MGGTITIKEVFMIKKDWTGYEKKIASRIEQTGNFGSFLEDHLEEFEELVDGQCDVFQLAKEVFEIESIVDEYENLEGFLQRLPDLGRAIELGIPRVDRYGLEIYEYAPTFRPNCEFRFFVVKGVNGTEILVHTNFKEFYKKYL